MIEAPNIVVGAGQVGRAVVSELRRVDHRPIWLVDGSASALASAERELKACQHLSFLSPGAETKTIAQHANLIVFATAWKDCRAWVAQLAGEALALERETPIVCIGRPQGEDEFTRQIPCAVQLLLQKRLRGPVWPHETALGALIRIRCIHPEICFLNISNG